MIEIYNNKEKNIIFEVAISGVSVSDLNGFFRMGIDGIEYGFKANISETNIEINIPSLKNIIHRPLREGEKINSKLEIYGNEFYLVPWKGDITLKNSIMIEAKIVEDKVVSKIDKKPSIAIIEKTNSGIKLPIKSKEVPVKKPVKELKDVNITKEHLFKYMEKKGTVDKKIQNIVLETCVNRVGDDNLKILMKEIIRFYKIKK